MCTFIFCVLFCSCRLGHVSTFNVLERKLTGGCKILFNLGNKFHKLYTSMINGAINVFIRVYVCVCVGGGGGGGGAGRRTTTENLY